MSLAHHPRQRTIWEEGRTPAFSVVALTIAVLLTVTVLDLGLSTELGMLFDLSFITACVAAALRVRPTDFFAVGTLPPLLMVAIMLLLAIAEPASVAHATDGVVQATVSGLSGHSLALVAGYGVCLAILGIRRNFLTRV